MILYAVLVVAAAAYLLPLYMTIATSLKAPAGIRLDTAWEFPRTLHWDGYAAAWERFAPQLRSIARPLLQDLSNKTNASAFISIADGQDCVPIDVVDADASVLHVTYRIGSRHPLTRGAAGHAILASRPPSDSDSEAVIQARAEGVSVSIGEIQPGAVGVASPVVMPGNTFGGIEASVGVVALNNLDVEASRLHVMACAKSLSELLK